MSPELEIEYLDYRFTSTLETRETGRVAVVDWPLDSISRGKTFASVMFERFLKRNDFADEDDARANLVDWLAQLVSPQGAPLIEIPAAQAAAANAVDNTVDGDASAAKIVSEVVVEIVSDLDWNELSMDGALNGTRYRVGGFERGKTWSFSHTCKIEVDDRLTKGGKALRVLAPPVTLAADGVMMIGAIVSLPVILVIAAPAAGVPLGP